MQTRDGVGGGDPMIVACMSSFSDSTYLATPFLTLNSSVWNLNHTVTGVDRLSGATSILQQAFQETGLAHRLLPSWVTTDK